MGVSMDEVFNTLQVYLGSLYVNDFNDSAGPGRSTSRATPISASRSRT